MNKNLTKRILACILIFTMAFSFCECQKREQRTTEKVTSEDAFDLTDREKIHFEFLNDTYDSKCSMSCINYHEFDGKDYNLSIHSRNILDQYTIPVLNKTLTLCKRGDNYCGFLTVQDKETLEYHTKKYTFTDSSILSFGMNLLIKKACHYLAEDVFPSKDKFLEFYFGENVKYCIYHNKDLEIVITEGFKLSPLIDCRFCFENTDSDSD